MWSHLNISQLNQHTLFWTVPASKSQDTNAIAFGLMDGWVDTLLIPRDLGYLGGRLLLYLKI